MIAAINNTSIALLSAGGLVMLVVGLLSPLTRTYVLYSVPTFAGVLFIALGIQHGSKTLLILGYVCWATLILIRALRDLLKDF